MPKVSVHPKLRKNLTNEERLELAKLVLEKQLPSFVVAKHFGVSPETAVRAGKRKKRNRRGNSTRNFNKINKTKKIWEIS